jgi:hypothetical protein
MWFYVILQTVMIFYYVIKRFGHTKFPPDFSFSRVKTWHNNFCLNFSVINGFDSFFCAYLIRIEKINNFAQEFVLIWAFFFEKTQFENSVFLQQLVPVFSFSSKNKGQPFLLSTYKIWKVLVFFLANFHVLGLFVPKKRV